VLRRSGRIAIAYVVIRSRQRLAAVIPLEQVLVMNTLRYADELKGVEELGIPAGILNAKATPKEIEMALRLIDDMAEKWQPEKFKDTYRDDLMAVIEAKRKGKEVHVAPDLGEEEEVPDLLTALSQSIERASRGRRTTRTARRASSDGDLERLSKAELEQRARKANVANRSKMSKRELVEALKRAA
jgi:DNA end-binding protein Ku